MRNNKYKHLYNTGKNGYNDNTEKKPYRAQNFAVHNLQVNQTPTGQQPTGQQPTAPQPTAPQPAAPQPTVQKPIEEAPLEFAGQTGNLSVGVFTALGALPVKGAVVTVYYLNDNKEEVVLSHQITDANGSVPDIRLPAVYSSENPLESPKYYFSTYNLRAEAENYYPVNILGIRIFPGVTTRYRIDMLPKIQGNTGVKPEQTFVIPPSPIDFSNE